jgi:anti-anti-sigma factor
MILRTSLRPELDADVVAFHGELDGAAAADLSARIGEVLAMPEGALLIDLSGCTFIDSLGVAALVRASKAMWGQGRQVTVAASHPQVRRILELSGADSLVRVWWTRDEAVTALSQG